jgi:intracellular septation protein
MTESEKQVPQGLKFALDFAPLLAFFVSYKFLGMYWATGIIIGLSIVSLAVGYAITRKVAKFPLFSTALIAIMGGLTLYLHDETFVKMKPTAVNLLFAAILGIGLFTNRLFLKDLLGSALDMPEAAWKNLTVRWVFFFIALAAANEFVWRTMSESAWVNFKVFGLMGLTLVFALANAPFMARHMRSDQPTN